MNPGKGRGASIYSASRRLGEDGGLQGRQDDPEGAANPSTILGERERKCYT